MMIRTAGISVTALGITMLIATGGCTRTSDGSYVMRRPAMLNHVIGEQQPVAELQPVSPPVYAEVAPPPVSSPPPQPVSSPPPQSKMPTVTVPAMSLTSNPPFRRADPDKPLSCKNETTSTGRIRFVCI